MPPGELPAGFSLSPGGVLSGSTTVAGPTSFTVTATDQSGFTASRVYTLTIDPNVATHFEVSVPSSATAGNPTVDRGVAFSLTLTVKDAYGNVVTGYTGTIHFSSTENRATLPANYTFTAADKGVHTFTGLILSRRGMQTITVWDESNNIMLKTTIDVL